MTITFEQIRELVDAIPLGARLSSRYEFVFPESLRETFIQMAYDFELDIETEFVSGFAEFGEYREIQYPKRRLPTSIYGYPIRFDDSVDSVGFVKKEGS